MPYTLTIHDKCPDCHVPIGTPHEDGCDVAQCLYTGEQRLSCDGTNEPAHIAAFGPTDDDWCECADNEACDSCSDVHECGWQKWSGIWPGEEECLRFGWFVKDKSLDQKQWDERCDINDPDAFPDLNRLHKEATWNRTTGRYELPAFY